MGICNEHLLQHNLMQKLITVFNRNMTEIRHAQGSATGEDAIAMATNLMAYVISNSGIHLDEISPTDNKPFNFHLIEMIRMQLDQYYDNDM